IGFCFLQATVLWADGFTYIDFASFSTRECRTKPMTDFVHDGAVKIPFTTDFLSLIGTHNLLGQWQDDVVHSRIHEIFEEYFLAALFFMNARIVGKIVSDRLVTMTQISRTKWGVHYFHRRLQSAFGW